MTKPSALPQWDSNNTNAIATTAGHKTDGYAVNEVPTSTELNGWMKLVYDWMAYLDASNPETLTHSVPLSPPGLATVLAPIGISGAAVWTVGLPVQIGRTITAIRARVAKGDAGTQVRVTLREIVDGAVTPAGNAATTGASTATQTLALTGLTKLTATGKSYEAQFDLTGSLTLSYLYALEFDTTP